MLNLFCQMIDNLVEPLRFEWVNQLCHDVCEEKKHLDKKTAAYDFAKLKYLGLRKVTKKEVVKKTEEELNKAKEEADEARYSIARKLTEVFSRGDDSNLNWNCTWLAGCSYVSSAQQLFGLLTCSKQPVVAYCA